MSVLLSGEFRIGAVEPAAPPAHHARHIIRVIIQR
jgi:hypothetical protein